MSLESLYQQVLLTERQMSEQTKKFQEVKVNIIRCSEKIKASTDKYEKAIEELHGKAQQLSEMTMQRDLMKKNEDQLLKQIQELLGVQSHLKERLRDSKEEEEKFLQEIQRFNSDFSLVGSRETVIESQTHSEILELEKKVQQLNREMELMRHRNSHMNSMQEERGVLQLELQGLDHLNKDLDCQLSEAEAVTEYLRAESLIVSQKPLTDSTCLSKPAFMMAEKSRAQKPDQHRVGVSNNTLVAGVADGKVKQATEEETDFPPSVAYLPDGKMARNHRTRHTFWSSTSPPLPPSPPPRSTFFLLSSAPCSIPHLPPHAT
ncbi:coiled-coil domain-containing protein 172 isoform X2 [Myripristis murdjan]|uniref:coiled-coil domain-containing protein 172 isoform X2 n=1 Tax=Myripristis murdjan TaxID=586833 RepID=UPI0011761F15|nr:coiled-coil domain-containing protein 172 isoform X2 [Myripristis murdjan]